MESAILFSLVLLLLLFGVPIALSLGLSSVIIIAFFSNDSLSSVAIQLFFCLAKLYFASYPFFHIGILFYVDWWCGTQNNPICGCYSWTFAWWNGNRIGFCLHAICGLIGFFPCNSCSDWNYSHYRHASSWVYQRICSRSNSQCWDTRNLDPTFNCDGRLFRLQLTFQLAECLLPE